MSLFIEDDDELKEEKTTLLEDRVDTTKNSSRVNADPHQSPRSAQSIPIAYHQDEMIPVYPDREVNCALPLKYQQEIVEDMLAKDTLLILGRGLGWEVITANLLHALSSPFVQLGKTQKKKSLIFVLNAREEEMIRLKEELNDLNWINNNKEPSEFVSISGDSQSPKRKATYLQGGIISISARVLVVDILTGMIDPNDITGLFVLRAERIRETSNDAFIINLFRDKNSWGFIKAFSDEPESFTGFTPLASRLKVLRLTNAMLWPRFHVTVTQSFNYHKKKDDSRKYVTEINVKLSSKMNRIQAALLTCIQACIGELKRHNPTLATEYWDMENVHDPDFVRIIRYSLESQWHRLTFTSKQLINDLTTLVELLSDLVTVDSVTFYQTIKGIVDANIKQQSGGLNRSMSPWLNLDESQTVISYAKDRAMGHDNNGEYYLEELPKWDQLGLLIDDILHEQAVNSDTSSYGPILIMCSSKKVAKQLRKLLLVMKKIEGDTSSRSRYDFRSYMVKRLQEYLSWKRVNELVKKINSDLNNESEKSHQEVGEGAEITMSKTFSRNGQPISKRRRTRGDSISARVERLYSLGNINGGDGDGGGNEDGDLTKQEEERIKQLVDADANEEGKEEEEEEEEEGVEEEVEREHADTTLDDIQANFQFINSDSQIIIQVYNETYNASFLEELSPSFIIMYQPDLSFIRRIEIYQAISKDNPAKVYFMYYGESVEEQKHLLRIKKEKEAFTRLIKEKATLSKHFETSDDNYKFQIQRNQVVNTRIAGGAQFRTENDEMRVVVDVREFGSSLPNLLYRIGIKVIPCMITIGDYIVSPRICVERKSIPDLISSFKSGRLYNQCEQMFRYYDLPTLLIEFDENKSFSLEPFSEAKFLKAKSSSSSSSSSNATTSSIDPKIRQNLQSQILSLLYSFPKLKIIWSSSPYETAQIFLELKSNQEEPDVGMALDKGVNRSVVTQDGGPPVYNDDPIDFIQNIPGINSMNYYSVIQKVRNIEELVKLSVEDFTSILGNENGRKAFNFINRQYG
ncbi:rad16 [Candida oxycetoniae]|uniref:Rad16 n=1 Tax=Candida oxycetoniae TaxID=497107 RepID=A0AAI9WZI9_9ASCO|nr:rad16 [Candida oxycetoniae]KAI3406114.2 rad16 [Candida oxycetoniae]